MNDLIIEAGAASLGTALLLGAAATLLLLGCLWGLRRAARRVTQALRERPALQPAPAEAPAGRVPKQRNPLAGREVLHELATLVRLALGAFAAVALWLWAAALLALLPGMREPARRALGIVLDPLLLAADAVLDYAPRLAYIAAVGFIAFALIRVARFGFAELGKRALHLPGFPAEWAAPTYGIVRFLVLAFAAVMAFPYLPGAGTPAFDAISIFLGVLFSLGSSGAVSNLVAGTVLTYTQAFRIGDRVRIADTEGDVIGRALLATRIRTIKNVDVTVPNARVLAEHIVNYSAAAQGPGLVLHEQVTIGYDVPWRRVHELLIEAARRTGHVLQDPAPYVLQSGLDDFYARYTVNATTREPNRQAAIYSELRGHIQDAFHEAGIEITSAHYTALRDGSRPARPGAPPAADAQPLRVALVEVKTESRT